MRPVGSTVLVAAAAAAGSLAGAAPAIGASVVAGDATNETGLAGLGPSHTHGATIADFDGNGWEDALVNRHYDSFPRLMLNSAGQFSDVTPAAFPTAPAARDYHGCVAADVDRNGRIDVYCTHGGRMGGHGANPNELWLQAPSGVFHEVASAYRVGDPFGRGREAVFLRANRDPWPDLYVANQYPRADGRPSPNKLYLNVEGKRFRSPARWGANKEIGGKAVDAADFDRDGDDDLLVCGKVGLRLLRNTGRYRFRDATKPLRAGGACLDAEFAAMNPGRLDLVVLTKQRLKVTFATGPGPFARRSGYSHPVDGAREFALADANGDDVLDAYVVRAQPSPPTPHLPPQPGDLPDLMLLSAGGPRTLAPFEIPQTDLGSGESVAAIDHDRNGLADFLVLNGHFNANGPTRLVAFYPAP